jgi:hypothetical protein
MHAGEMSAIEGVAEQVNRMRHSAKAVEMIGCDQRCRPVRAGLLRRPTGETAHTPFCIGRHEFAERVRGAALRIEHGDWGDADARDYEA